MLMAVATLVTSVGVAGSDAKPAGCDAVVTEPAKLQATIDAAAYGDVVYVPKGVYELERTLYVTNGVSLKLHKSAILRAVKPMEYVVRVDFREQRNRGGGRMSFSGRPEDFNLFFEGGRIDANGQGSCLFVDNYWHCTLRYTAFLNGKKYGLHVGQGCELFAYDLYFICTIPGLAGNTALYQPNGDSHFTDVVVVDYTVGVHDIGGANRYTRCHVWCGPVAEMLKDSINFKIESSGSIFRDCYADTGQIGFYVAPWDNVRLLGCHYFSNPIFKLDNIVMVKHVKGDAIISECQFSKKAKHVRLYEAAPGKGKITWRDCFYAGEWEKDDIRPANVTTYDPNATHGNAW